MQKGVSTYKWANFPELFSSTLNSSLNFSKTFLISSVSLVSSSIPCFSGNPAQVRENLSSSVKVKYLLQPKVLKIYIFPHNPKSL